MGVLNVHSRTGNMTQDIEKKVITENPYNTNKITIEQHETNTLKQINNSITYINTITIEQ